MSKANGVSKPPVSRETFVTKIFLETCGLDTADERRLLDHRYKHKIKNMKTTAHVYSIDNIDTDRIIPGKYTKTLDMSALASHVLEDLDPEFSKKVQQGDILVAGNNFGCGSSREQAPIAIKSAGVSIVVAKTFARIFYRNAINIGLPVVEVEHHNIQSGDSISVDLEKGIVTNYTKNETYQATKMPQQMIDILNAGGLVNYLIQNGDYV